MERFVKEYASYIIKHAKAYKDTEKIAKVEKICKMRMRGLISPTEAMHALANADEPYIDSYGYKA